MAAVLLACATMAVYFTGFAIFKLAAPQLDQLSSARPFHTAGRLLLNVRWLAGLVVVLTGLCMESRLLLSVPLAIAIPVLVANLIFLLLIAIAGFGERLSSREWAALGTVALVVAALAASAKITSVDYPTPAWPDTPAAWGLAAIVSPPLAIAVWMFCIREVDGGRHARPLNGIAHGLAAGSLVGIAAVLAMGLARTIQVDGPAGIPANPSLYLIIVTGGLGLGLAQIALQHSRLIVIVTIVMVTSKIYLLVTGSLLFGQPWPDDPVLLSLRLGGIALAFFAIWLFPRHERRRAPDALQAEEPPAAEADPVAAAAASYPGHHRRVQGRIVPSDYTPPDADAQQDAKPNTDVKPPSAELPTNAA
jgi:hypothetical protein